MLADTKKSRETIYELITELDKYKNRCDTTCKDEIKK